MNKKHVIFLFLTISLGSIYFLHTSETKKTESLIYLHERITDGNSQEDVLNSLISNGNSVVVFYKDRCGACKNTTPILESLATTFPRITFIKIDVEKCTVITSRYDIKSVPTILFLKNGKEVKRRTGAIKSKEYVIEIIKNVF